LRSRLFGAGPLGALYAQLFRKAGLDVADGTPGWYGLGPVSALPECQRQGIGTVMVQEELSQRKALGASACCVVGHPEYCRKFGFENSPSLRLERVPPEVFFALPFEGRTREGAVAFHEASQADGEQGH
jgi:putative acetyltransferase